MHFIRCRSVPQTNVVNFFSKEAAKAAEAAEEKDDYSDSTGISDEEIAQNGLEDNWSLIDVMQEDSHSLSLPEVLKDDTSILSIPSDFKFEESP